MNQWFRRLAEVPGIEYEYSPNIDRSLLPQHDAIPEIRTYESSLDGKIDDFISWKTTEGSTSVSPTHRWQKLEPQLRLDETIPQAILRQLMETLELPGILSDYHDALQNCHEVLWKYRRDEPWVIAEIEWLCCLDLQLKEIQKILSTEGSIYSVPDYMPYCPALSRLVKLYEREGNLQEAFAIAQRGNISYQDRKRKTFSASLQLRLAQLEAEDNA